MSFNVQDEIHLLMPWIPNQKIEKIKVTFSEKHLSTNAGRFLSAIFNIPEREIRPIFNRLLKHAVSNDPPQNQQDANELVASVIYTTFKRINGNFRKNS